MNVVSNLLEEIGTTRTQEISSEDERERNKMSKIDAFRLQTAKWIKKARLMAEDNQLEEAKDIIIHAQSLLYDEDFAELDKLKSDLRRLLKLLKTKETYEKEGRDFALGLENSCDLAERGNEGPSSGTGKTIKMKIKTRREAPLEETKFNVRLEFSSNETPGLDRRSAVQDLMVTIAQENSKKIEVSAENYSQYKFKIGSVIVWLGDLYGKELRNVVVDLLLPDVSSTMCTDILGISYTYSFEGELIHTNPIIVTITRRNSAPMINEARVVTEKQLEIARKMINEAQNSLQSEFDETLKSEVQQLKRLMNSQKPYDQQESVEVTIDESGEGTIRSSPPGQTSTVQGNNDGKKIPIEFLLDHTVVRQIIPQSLNRSNNYVSWSENVKYYLVQLNLWKVIEPSFGEYIENEPRATELKKFRENWMALILIIQACGFPINLQIIDLHSAREAWDTLATNRKQGGRDVQSFLSGGERGDWKTVERLLDSNPELAKARIPSSQNTVLHLASLAGEVNIVKKLVALMVPQDLEIKDKDGYTALAKASMKGNKIIVQSMVEKNRKLVSIPTGTKLLPVVIAMMYGNKEIASYLYCATPTEDLTNKGNINGATLLTYSIRMQFYDICSNLIKKSSRLALALDHNGESALYQLACTPSAFRSCSMLKFWQRWMYNCIPVQDIHWNNNETWISVSDEDVSQSNSWKAADRGIWQQIASRLLTVLGIKRIYEMKLVHHHSRGLLDFICEQIKDDLDDHEINDIINALHEAAARGVVEFVVKVLKKFPEFRWLRDEEGSTIFMKAVQFRQADVFCLIHEFPSQDKMVVLVDNWGENIFHKLKHSSVDKTSTIQGLIKMQKELKWFKEIKSMMPPDSLKTKNLERKTAQDLIDYSHKELRSNAEEGVKKIVDSCIIVGILVVTITFAAALTVPGGNNQNTGLPIFIKKKLFKIFIISDAISLCSSTASVFIFLGILTSRYAEIKDFLEFLPRKMAMALLTLFISIAAMMIAFASTFFLMVRTEFRISLPLTYLLAFLPVIVLARSFFPLFSECAMSAKHL